jgi:class 3 adenylate cyclase
VSETGANSRRVLAAIVFTDVVGSSALMSVDERKTLALIERDFRMMRRACEHFDGQILKNTGDGLLMHFSSAVQAVSCALRMQRTLAEAQKKLPPDQVLKHRIGIHLGDVFVSDHDVMGDGVNIAARLQESAEPGGICISQTVYDVVKNRLALTTTSLGPQELRNIQGKVPVYRILLDASAAATGPADPRRHRPRDGPGALDIGRTEPGPRFAGRAA